MSRLPELTLDGLESWLRARDPETEYTYLDNCDCLVARYAKSLGYPEDLLIIPATLPAGNGIIILSNGVGGYPRSLDRVAVSWDDKQTYGHALERLEAVRLEEAS